MLKKYKRKTMIYKTSHKRSGNTNPTKNWGELRCSGRVSSLCSTSGTHRVTLVNNSMHVKGQLKVKRQVFELCTCASYIYPTIIRTKQKNMSNTDKNVHQNDQLGIQTLNINQLGTGADPRGGAPGACPP